MSIQGNMRKKKREEKCTSKRELSFLCLNNFELAPNVVQVIFNAIHRDFFFRNFIVMVFIDNFNFGFCGT